jgi:hypothetical protein
MFYSGAPIKEEQMYTGGTYAPAIANIQNAAQNQKYSLQGALAGVGINQTNQANSLYQTQLGQDQQQNQFNQQLQMQQQQNQAMRDIYSRNGSSGGGGGAAAPANPFNIGRDSSGGYAVTMNGRPATLAQYAASQGGGFQNVLSMLGQGSAGDRQLAGQLANSHLSPAQLQQKYPQIFGGV